MNTLTHGSRAVSAPRLRRHHAIALVTSAGLSAIALFDAVTHGLTGQSSAFADDSAHQGIATFGGVVHGVAYVALAVVLLRERALFTSRLTIGLRYLLLGAFAIFSVLFLIATPLVYLTTGRAALPEDHALSGVLGLVATAAFLAMLLGGTILGLTQVRRASLGLGGRVLIALAPVLGVTVLLGVLAPDWTHPGYLETTLNLGVSLIGVGLVADRTRVE